MNNVSVNILGSCAHSMNRTILILNSAQSKYPRGDDPWVRATIRAFDQLSANDAVFLTSADPLMWSFAAWLAARHGVRIRHIIADYNPHRAKASFKKMLTTFDIREELAAPLYLKSGNSVSRADVWQLRDRTAIESAGVIYPVSIRPGGRLETLLRAEPIRAGIKQDFSINWRDGLRRRTPVYDLLKAAVNPLPAGDWLVHWTRSSPGPWPGETVADFFRDMLAHPAMHVRSARETLIRILNEKFIRASSWKIPGQVPVVSLTENTPETAITLMKWRKRFIRYTYEPYGIALRTSFLEPAGARKVIYTEHGTASDPDSWMFQSPGEFADWTREREWRFPGDLPLTGIKGRDWFIIVPRKEDKEYVESRCEGVAGRVFVLFGG